MRRGYYPAGVTRQLVAIIASGDRRRLLRKIGAPTLVIHGAADPLVPVEAGRDTARHIAGAKLEVIDGMGHDLPPGAPADPRRGDRRALPRQRGPRRGEPALVRPPVSGSHAPFVSARRIDPKRLRYCAGVRFTRAPEQTG